MYDILNFKILVVVRCFRHCQVNNTHELPLKNGLQRPNHMVKSSVQMQLYRF